LRIVLVWPTTPEKLCQFAQVWFRPAELRILPGLVDSNAPHDGRAIVQSHGLSKTGIK
jgi:hypothetical protein